MYQEQTDRSTVFQEFVESGLHNSDCFWPKVTHAVVPFWAFGRPLIANSSWHEHAEINLLQQMSTYPDFGRPISIYINYSPCSDCGQKLAQVFHYRPVEIVFAAFWKVLRPSCKERECRHCNPRAGWEDDVETLRYLQTHLGWRVRPFVPQDWLHLATALGLPLAQGRWAAVMREEEDMYLWRDFRTYFPPYQQCVRAFY